VHCEEDFIILTAVVETVKKKPNPLKTRIYAKNCNATIKKVKLTYCMKELHSCFPEQSRKIN
jgi:hypothetical protein